MVSEARKGILLVREFLQQQGITVPETFDSQIHTPFTSINMGSEAMLQAMLGAVREVTPFHHTMPHHGVPGEKGSEHAGGSFIQGCVADIGVAGIMVDPFPCVVSGGTHWSQWINVLSQLQR